MTRPAGEAGPSDSCILHDAIAMCGTVRAHRDQIEQERRLPPAVVRAMKDAGVFGMAMPRDWDGPELDPLTQFRVIEALGMADGSVGWCAMINCDGGYITAFLDQDAGRALYADLQAPTAACASTTGEARGVTGGYRVSGRFPFASGCQHCDWVWVGCTVTDNGTPLANRNGVPETRQCLLPVADCEILDTWFTTGLRGTGSNDLRVDNVFVPADRTFSFQDPGLIKRPGPLYAFPFMYVTKASAPALGIARHAIDMLIETAAGKPARRYMLGDRMEAPKTMRDDVYVQEAVGRAETMLASARAHLFEVVGDIWATLSSGGEPTPRQIACVMALNTHVMGVCADVVRLVCKAAGGSAVYQAGPFDRCLRDVLTMNQHVVATLRTYEMAGRLLLGLESLMWLL